MLSVYFRYSSPRGTCQWNSSNQRARRCAWDVFRTTSSQRRHRDRQTKRWIKICNPIYHLLWKKKRKRIRKRNPPVEQKLFWVSLSLSLSLSLSYSLFLSLTHSLSLSLTHSLSLSLTLSLPLSLSHSLSLSLSAAVSLSLSHSLSLSLSLFLFPSPSLSLSLSLSIHVSWKSFRKVRRNRFEGFNWWIVRVRIIFERTVVVEISRQNDLSVACIEHIWTQISSSNSS